MLLSHPDVWLSVSLKLRVTKKIDWLKRKRDICEIAQWGKRHTKVNYDCIVAVSGGKDSTWQVVKCLEYGLNPLAVTWKTPVRTLVGQKNLDNLIRNKCRLN